ncbi:hypothetical protein D3C85_1063560 [compost metagenome]
MSIIYFNDVFNLYVDRGVMDSPSMFALKGFAQQDLEGDGYDLVGDPAEFHLYEKVYLSNYYRDSVCLNFKHYFLSGQRVGNGFDIVGVNSHVRLITLLKYYLRYKKLAHISEAPIEFYFSEAGKDGAVIIDNMVAIQFKQKSKMGGYIALTLESDFDRSGKFSLLSTGPIRSMMNRYELDKACLKSRRKYQVRAFERLTKFCSS